MLSIVINDDGRELLDASCGTQRGCAIYDKLNNIIIWFTIDEASHVVAKKPTPALPIPIIEKPKNQGDYRHIEESKSHIPHKKITKMRLEFDEMFNDYI